MIKPSLLLLACIAACSSAKADTYRSINDHGITEFSDRAMSATAKKFTISKPVIIEPLSEIPAVRSPKTNSNAQQSEPLQTGALYKGLKILEPEDNSTRWVQDEVSVKIALDPGLAAGHEVALVLDGIEVASGDHFNYSIPEIIRGQHILQAQIRDTASGETLTSETISFHVHRHSDQSDKKMLHPSLQTEVEENPSDISVILSY